MIDFERLRADLIQYFGTATAFYAQAFMDVNRVMKATDEELLEIALENGFSFEDYRIEKSL